jgi:solute carrier family 25 folate transporter 32
VATLVMHPLDLVKVRFQLAEAPQPVASTSKLPAASKATSATAVKKPKLGRAVYGALADAVRADGWKGLYRGLVPNLVGGAGSWGLYFLL